MTCQEAIDFIHGIERFGSKPGLRRVKQLLDRMGNPQDRLRFIHVAGTNGKGSVCSMLSHILTLSGYRTGLYISPFVTDFRERIQLDNTMIPGEELARSTQTVKAHWEELNALGETPTEFEVLVAVAMDYFHRSGCEAVVLETGLGGRYDATNVISSSLVSVITSIGLDHTEYLGDTMGKIAAEKCGIIKYGGITVTSPRQDPEALAVIMEACAEKGNRLMIPGNPVIKSMGPQGSILEYDGMEIHLPLAGEHQADNAMTVIETVRALEMTTLDIGMEQAVRGIAATRFPARFEKLSDAPPVFLDGAHNLPGARALRKTMELLGDRSVHMLIGMMADKDVEGCLREILPRAKSVVTTTVPDMARAMTAEALARLASKYHGDVTAVGDVAAALEKVLFVCGGEDVVVICGSLYLASAVRPMLLR